MPRGAGENKMKNLISALVATAFLSIAFSETAFAHARILSTVNLKARSTSSALKTAPCGGVGRTATPVVLAAGSVLVVNWEETVDHPGRFEFSFSAAGDNNFVPIKSGTGADSTVIDSQNGTAGLPHQYSTTLTVPAANCSACTIRLIQVMTENNPPSLYYSCADVQVTGGTSEPVTPTPPPGTTPETCN